MSPGSLTTRGPARYFRPTYPNAACLALLAAVLAVGVAQDVTSYLRFLRDDEPVPVRVISSHWPVVPLSGPGTIEAWLPDGRDVTVTGRPLLEPEPGTLLWVQGRRGDPTDVRYGAHAAMFPTAVRAVDTATLAVCAGLVAWLRRRSGVRGT